MALIKPRTRGKQLVRHRTRLDHETNETLYAYAKFIGESTEYVLNQVIDTVLGKDKDYLQWRASHKESFVPRGAGNHGSSRVPGSRSRPALASEWRVNHARLPCKQCATMIESRALVALTAAAIFGTMGLRAFPIDADEPFLSAIGQQRPDLLGLLGYGYALLWFSTPFHRRVAAAVHIRNRSLPQSASHAVSRIAAVSRTRNAPNAIRGSR